VFFHLHLLEQDVQTLKVLFELLAQVLGLRGELLEREEGVLLMQPEVEVRAVQQRAVQVEKEALERLEFHGWTK
jgi:hypothetical protein